MRKVTLTLTEYLAILFGLSISTMGNVLFIIWIARIL
jgi:hypothetical protein